ncbi:MAG: hypothetical protein HYS41_03785 [Candidatus Omnitrophica bacterium]|nr:hypothetical protein [Candidatus Omnitrophota bacterium]
MRQVLVLLILLNGAGCGRGFAILERPKGQIELHQPEVVLAPLTVTPPTASVSKLGIDVTVRYAAPAELENFFKNEKIFGKLAGKNPYPAETLIFYVKVANHSAKKIKVNPDDFVMIDNLNIQYAELSPDNISALYETKANVWAYAKSTGDLAPGPYGIPLKAAALAGGGGGRKLHYLIKSVRLAGGYVHPGIAYDGYVAFPRPHPNTTSVRVLIANLKTDFNPADEPATAIDFEFPLAVESKKP